jgi:hypothetical protein
MGVQVDEAGAEHRPGAVDDVALDPLADRGDQAVLDPDVGAKGRPVARVHLGTAEDEHQTTASRPPST